MLITAAPKSSPTPCLIKEKSIITTQEKGQDAKLKWALWIHLAGDHYEEDGKESEEEARDCSFEVCHEVEDRHEHCGI